MQQKQADRMNDTQIHFHIYTRNLKRDWNGQTGKEKGWEGVGVELEISTAVLHYSNPQGI